MANEIREIRITDEYGETVIFDVYYNRRRNENRVQILIDSTKEGANDYMDDEDIVVDLSVSEFLNEIDGIRNKMYYILKNKEK